MSTLWQRYQDLKAEQAYLFQYDAARQLGVSEGELLASAPDSIYLGSDFVGIFNRLQAIQQVQLVVRNQCAVHEKITHITPLKLNEKVGLATDVGGFDVRLFPQKWAHAFAHDFVTHGKTMRSIQFYGAHGFALQKVYLHSSDDDALWQAIVDDFKQANKPQILPQHQPTSAPIVALSREDAAEFQERWRNLGNIHHFFGLLEEFKLSRKQAFEAAPRGYAFKVDNSCVEKTYEAAAAAEVPLITFVGNHGIIQIQTGTVKHISRQRGWLNIFDQKHNGFTMHIDDSKIESTWLLLRPTRDGIVSCLECLDAFGHTVLTVFGQRTEGQAELAAWRDVLQAATGKTVQDEVMA